MKTKSNIALEGTCSGDVVGGLLSWIVPKLDRFYRFYEHLYITPRDRRVRLKRASLAPARGLTGEKVRGLLWE